jgi:hypothetical protein
MLTQKSPLHQTVSTTSTEFWNDSCSVPELTYAIKLLNLIRDFMLPNLDVK